MPFAYQAETVSPALSGTVILIAVGLAIWQERDRRSRDRELSPADARHFKHQDVRRWLVVATLILVAVGIGVGSQLHPRTAVGPNLWFVRTWLVVCLGVLLLIGLALADWIATSRYARRHRRTLLREGVDILKQNARLRSARAARRNGRSHPGGEAPSHD
jgi:protein-S-isoprenylcysteine O-methyltransferase Ste14